MRPAHIPADTLVFRFDAPHKVGTICGFPCEQCGPDLKGVFILGKLQPNTPFVILADATADDFIQSVRKHRGKEPRIHPGYFYYFVSMD